MTVGAVAIGRNEGERLERCLRSLVGQVDRLVYVDSGSRDGSPARARELGAEVCALDPDVPFSAGRARNLGFERLRALHPGLRFVQFVDGDCEVAPGWIPAARAHLDAHPEVAAVCGRRRERAPDASLYNRLTDMEWDTPVGERNSVGGDSLFRVAAFAEAGGFDPTLIAGEEPELCFRVRRNGHRIHRIDREMTLHDADLRRFGQWWKRQARSGHAYAESAWLHARGEERFLLRNVASILVWALAPPALALALFGLGLGAGALLPIALYGWLAFRVAAGRRAQGDSARHAGLYGVATVIGKFAECQGVLQFGWNRFVRRRRTALIEYKG
ncbi:MAG: glycosyltransferase family 2 protein [Myxococcales bacterium]|nr:glycosyltransferase family 2 protein [Myxococcales bacterium]